MHKYRTHKCNQLRYEDVKETVRLSGWVHRKRDHGQLIFIDLRDHYGLTQVVVDYSNTYFPIVENISLESVITITGTVVKRSDETINKYIKDKKEKLGGGECDTNYILPLVLS